MKMLIPVITEKTMKLAGDGKYTFKVDISMNKYQARELVEKSFGVKVVGITSVNKRAMVKRNNKGKKRIIQPEKKIVVKLNGKDKIDLFTEKKK
jgi:large subunit ribosomal protein L23